jgi:hypothetical protein
LANLRGASSLSERNGKALVFKYFADPTGAIFRRKTVLSDSLLVAKPATWAGFLFQIALALLFVV